MASRATEHVQEHCDSVGQTKTRMAPSVFQAMSGFTRLTFLGVDSKIRGWLQALSKGDSWHRFPVASFLCSWDNLSHVPNNQTFFQVGP